MTKVQPITGESVTSKSKESHEQHLAPTPIDRILQKLSCMELPAKEHFECYMRYKWRLSHKPKTLASSFTSVMLFLDFYGKLGKRELGEMERVDLEAFIEHEQDRGLCISTVGTRLACIIAFFHYLMDQEVISGSLLKRGIKLKLPEVLPRAMNPADVPKLLFVMDDIRDRALILLLLRTGMRIGEALGLRVNDLDIRGRKIHLFEGEKNRMGRLVYLSDDALFAIKLWLSRRDKSKEFVFYGRGNTHLCYSTGRSRFVKKYYIDYYNPNGKRHREVAVSRKEEIKDQVRKGKYFAERKKYTTTFDELIQRYREIFKDQKCFERAKKFALKSIGRYFSGKLLSQISPYDIESYKRLRKETSITVMRRKGDIWVNVDTGRIRSNASVNRELAYLSHLFSKTVEWEMMEESPFRKMRRLFFKENNQRTRFLTEEEIKSLLAVEYEGCPAYLKPIIATAIYTGLRKGEILNLKWKDVVLERGLIYVRENKQNHLQVKMVNDDLIDLFMKLPVKGEYLFHDEEGKPLRDIKRLFQTALRRAGIEDFRFHDLRHTSCSYLTMRGAPMQSVQDHAGHSSIKMTMRYSHLSPAFQKGSIQLLNGLCQRILKGSEANGEKIVKNGQKDQEVKQIQLPNPS